MITTVLVVEDQKHINNTISTYFRHAGFDVISAFTGHEALSLFNKDKIDLIILDVMLPGMDGWSLCKQFRSRSDVLIIMLTALEGENDKLLGFDMGADEYVTKPFSPKVLLARSKALLERVKGGDITSRIQIGKVSLDMSSHKVFIDSSEIELTPKEYLILQFLFENKNIALSRNRIIDTVWGYDFYGDARVVDTHMKNLRKKLAHGSIKIITVKGIGYRLEAEE